SPFTIFAVLKGKSFVNSALQNAFVPSAIKFAEHEKSFIGGDDLKSSLPSSSSMPPQLVRQAPGQGQGDLKEISKSSVVAANRLSAVVVRSSTASEWEESLLATPLILDPFELG
ncbi:hypothetical protein FA15DRAFT_709820, partial [Coprinopsis marcescibilis]